MATSSTLLRYFDISSCSERSTGTILFFFTSNANSVFSVSATFSSNGTLMSITSAHFSYVFIRCQFIIRNCFIDADTGVAVSSLYVCIFPVRFSDDISSVEVLLI